MLEVQLRRAMLPDEGAREPTLVRGVGAAE